MKTKVAITIQSGYNRDIYIFDDVDVTEFQKVLKPRTVSILELGKESPSELEGTTESVRLSFEARGEMEHRKDTFRTNVISD